MSSLLSVDEAKALLHTALSDAQLQVLINREEAELVRRFGAHYTDASTAITETVGGGMANLYLRRPVGSVDSILEKYFYLTETGYALTENEEFVVWGGEGRLERLPYGSKWARFVVVEYVPVDDNDRRKAAIIDLLRLAIQRTAMKSESVAGEYSYNAPDWLEERMRIYSSLGFPVI